MDMDFMSDLKKNGFVELMPGVLLWLREDLQAVHGTDIDFSAYQFWLTTNDGKDAEGFESIDDAVLYLA